MLSSVACKGGKLFIFYTSFQKLRKDIQHNFGRVDYSNYRLPGDNISDSEYMEHIERLHNMSTVDPPSSGRKSNRQKQENLDCWCADEEDVNGHELDPKE